MFVLFTIPCPHQVQKPVQETFLKQPAMDKCHCVLLVSLPQFLPVTTFLSDIEINMKGIQLVGGLSYHLDLV